LLIVSPERRAPSPDRRIGDEHDPLVAVHLDAVRDAEGREDEGPLVRLAGRPGRADRRFHRPRTADTPTTERRATAGGSHQWWQVTHSSGAFLGLCSLPGGITTDGFGMSAMFCTAPMPFSFTVR